MRAGVIGLVDGDFEEIESETHTYNKDGKELSEAIDIQQPLTLSDGTTAIYGYAAQEDTIEKETVQIQEGNIGTYSEIQTDTTYTEFLAIPGEYIVVENGSGTFAFDMIGRQTDVNLERAEIDLDTYVNSIREKNRENQFWQAGFYGNSGRAEKGVVYGQEVLNDSDVGGVLDLSKLNQLGLEFSNKEDEIKMSITQSGYISVYQPSNFESDDFLELINDELLHHLKGDNQPIKSISVS